MMDSTMDANMDASMDGGMDAALDGGMGDGMDGGMDGGMDSGMPVDLDGVDLFGDPVDLMATATPPSKKLLQQIDDMRSRGSCQKIAWSKHGAIASVAHDGRSIELRYLFSDPTDGSWKLSDPTPYSQFGATQPESRIVHLSWAGSMPSSELAVIDDVGRVSFLAVPSAVNKPVTTRNWDSEPFDDLHAVAGSFWLPLVPPSRQHFVTQYGPAIRDGNGYRFEQSPTPAIGPFHPNPMKSAFLCVTSNGLLKLFYYQNNSTIQQTSLEMETIGSADDIITHASMCADKSGQLYIALAHASKQLKIMRVQIDWGLPSQADKQTAPHALPLNPTLKEKRVAMTSWLQNDTVAAGLASHIDYAMTQLSLLEVLPGVPNGDGQPWAPPLVLTVRSYVPTGYGGGLQSTVDIWEILSDQPQQLHQAFQQLSSRNGLGSNPQPATRLRKLESIVFQKVVVSINLLHSGRVVCFAFSDGSIQHRDRVTMTEIHASPDLDRIVTLNQMGFHYAEESPCLQVAFSPSSCSFVQICENGKIKWNHLKFPAGDIGSTPQDVQYSAVIAGLTVALSTAVASMANFDDILILARQFNSKPRFAIDWIGQIVRLLRVHVDYSEGLSQDALVRNTNLQVCLSIMNHMGFGGEFRPRSFGGKFSLITLHVRNLVILITLANNANSQRKVTPLDEPEVVEVLASSFKWTVDLLTWISDCIFELEDDVKFMTLLNASPGSQTDWKDLFSYLQSKEDVVLHLLLCSSSRGFLISVCRRLLHLDDLGKKAVQYYQQQFAKGAPSLQGSADSYENHTRLFSAYQKMYAHASNSMIDIAQLEKLLSGLGSQITTVYEQSFRIQAQRALQQPQQGTNANRQQQQQQTDARVKALQNQNELMLLLGGTPFAVLQPMLKKFFETDLQAFKATVPDRAKLYFADYSSLGILDDRHSLKERRKNRGRYVDTFSHVEMRPDAPQPKGQQESTASPSQWRRCVRCTSVMEDTTADPKTGLAIVMVNTNQRRCCCGANWSVVPRGNTVV